MFASTSPVTRLVATLMEYLLSIIVGYFVVFTFGASLFNEDNDDIGLTPNYNSLVYSALMSLVCVMPLLVLVPHEDPLALLVRVLVHGRWHSRLEYHCRRVSLCAMVGSWLGALVIPLDWDTWWQQWPISCLLGAGLGLGYCAASTLGFAIFGDFKVKQHI